MMLLSLVLDLRDWLRLDTCTRQACRLSFLKLWIE